MYEPGYGLIDGVLHFFGLGAPGWLSSTTLALYSIVIVTVWWTIGFNFVLFVAGLQDIPQRHVRGGIELDGANLVGSRSAGSRSRCSGARSRSSRCCR